VVVIGVGGLVVWSVGAAEAATGGKFLLGKSNHETRTATLSNSKGVPLSLKAKAGSPPLKVNSSKLVPKLNANFVGGVPASKLQRRVSGSCAIGVGSITATGGVSCAKPNQLVFTANGSVTIPKGVTEITGEIWGGGGGGGDSYHSGPYNDLGQSGGEGGYERAVIPVIAGQVLDIAVGAAGHGAVTYDPAGTAGGASALKTVAGSVLAGAGGGAGGISYGDTDCSGVAPGGDPMAIASGGIGVEGRSGAAGQCGGGVAGRAGFVGAGGPLDVGSGHGGDGQPGLVIINFAD
jgi:hypothetical protein